MTKNKLAVLDVPELSVIEIFHPEGFLIYKRQQVPFSL